MTPPAPTRGGWLTVIATISLALGALGVVGNGLPLLLSWTSPQPGASDGLWPADIPVPPVVAWLQAHWVALSLAGLALSALLTWTSWGLLRRREWARRTFIAGLILMALANFACLPLLDALFAGLIDSPAPADLGGAQLQAVTLTLQRAAFWACLAGAVLIAAVHGWIAWHLSRPAIRTEFGRREPSW